MTAVTPPDVSVWWDPAVVQAAALARLRIGAGDVDAGRVADLVDPAGQMINGVLDRPDAAPTPPPAWLDAIVTVVVDMYRDQSAPPAADLAFPGYRVTDPLAQVRTQLAPWRARFGVG